MNKFSVLISVYASESSKYLELALKSIWDDQLLKPDEIVIVKDGPLNFNLDHVIEIFRKSKPVKLVELDENLGLGLALAIGLKNCKYDIVARMDSDDISRFDRFSKQIPLMSKGYDVVSSWSKFFENEIDNTIATKKRPEFHEDIYKLAKRRSPVCHASSILRKSKVIDSGNYRNVPMYEDYDLWVRMLLNKSKFYNLQDYVYLIRGSNNQFGRRGGLNYLRTEIISHINFYNLGFLNFFELTRNLIFRILVRTQPIVIRRKIYLLIWKISRTSKII
tara:strand:- start:1838 stop:2668 length:831 start_codon:yes stop_codon:yes gene_type:complete